MRVIDGQFDIPVKFWERKVVPYEGAARNVQFCGQGRGRINGIFQCYNPGEMHCYQAEADAPLTDRELDHAVEPDRSHHTGEHDREE